MWIQPSYIDRVTWTWLQAPWRIPKYSCFLIRPKLYFLSYSRGSQSGIKLRPIQLEAAIFRYSPLPGSSQTCQVILHCPWCQISLCSLKNRESLAFSPVTMIITRLAEEYLFPILNFIAKFFYYFSVDQWDFIACPVCNSYVDWLSNQPLSEESAALPELFIWVQSKASALLCCTYEIAFHNSYFPRSPSKLSDLQMHLLLPSY